MLYLLILIAIFIFLFYLYRDTSILEGWHNYNYRNHYHNLFNLFPYNYRSPYNQYNTFYSTGIHSVPHYNTFHDPSHDFVHHYSYHNYLSNLPLTGYIDRRSLISTPPLTHTNLFP